MTYNPTVSPSGVATVFGRSGAVVAQAGDYDFADLGTTPTTLAGYGITDAQATLGWVTVTEYGAVGDGVADDSPAVASALAAAASAGGAVFFPPGTYRLTATVALNSAARVLRGAGIGRTTIRRDFNGDLFDVTQPLVDMADMTIDLAGATTTGRGIYVNNNPGTTPGCVFRNLRFDNAAEVAIEFEADAGSGTLMADLTLNPTAVNVPLVKHTGTDSGARPRLLVNANAGAGNVFDVEGVDNFLVTNCFGRSATMTSGSRKVIASALRVATAGGTFTIDGTDNCFTGLVVGGPVTIAATASNCVAIGVVPSGALTNNAPASCVLFGTKAGWTAPTGTASRATFNTATVTTQQLAERVKALLDDFLALGVLRP